MAVVVQADTLDEGGEEKEGWCEGTKEHWVLEKHVYHVVFKES